MPETNLTKSFLHWLTPLLSACVSIIAFASLVFYTGGSAQRLATVEETVKKIDSTTIKKSEVKYQLDTIEKNIDEIKRELKEQRRR